MFCTLSFSTPMVIRLTNFVKTSNLIYKLIRKTYDGIYFFNTYKRVIYLIVKNHRTEDDNTMA